MYPIILATFYQVGIPFQVIQSKDCYSLVAILIDRTEIVYTSTDCKGVIAYGIIANEWIESNIMSQAEVI